MEITREADYAIRCVLCRCKDRLQKKEFFSLFKYDKAGYTGYGGSAGVLIIV
jgi:hypothetical protein